MLFLDAPVVFAQAELPQSVYVNSIATQEQINVGRFGYCFVTAANSRDSQSTATWMFYKYMAKDLRIALDDSARFGTNVFTGDQFGRFLDWEKSFSAKVLQAPKNGNLGHEDGSFWYAPNKDYLGKDKAVIMVEGKTGDGRPVSAIAEIYIVVVRPEKYTEYLRASANKEASIRKGNCPVYKKDFWRISDSGSDGLSRFGANGYGLALDSSALVGAFGGFEELGGVTLAQTTGTGPTAQITLDTDAAGYGWFIDDTPYLNDEFLPTSNPNEWVARPGSAAEGKMDRLTVLLHEYGHALGLEHSADVHDFMAATLQPGVRRTLSVEEQMALMALAGVFATPDSPSASYAPFAPMGLPLLFTRVSRSRKDTVAAALAAGQ